MSAVAAGRSRILGLETEYGCLVAGGGTRAVLEIRDWFFERHRLGLIDRHERGWDEPPGNGGFLFNGGRIYLDMGHLEYCTPECAALQDLVRYDRAGDRLLLGAVKALGLDGSVSFIRNNIDHHTGATFGCHENYSLLRAAPLTVANVKSLIAFLTLRVLLAGSGRVGEAGAFSCDRERRAGVEFQISQRADYIETELYEWVQHNRAIINTRDEPLADRRRYRRLHLLHGDTNVLPAALYLKMGSTRLVLDLLDADDLPSAAVADAVDAMRVLSRHTRPPWRIALADGRKVDAVELLGRFRARARARFAGRDAETDAILALWARVEKGLAGDLDSLVGLVDWVTKLHLLEHFRQREGLRWGDPWLKAQDLEYHQVDPKRSLGIAMADLTGPWARGLEDPTVLAKPPQDTRAVVRSRLMHRIAESGEPYEIDWHFIERGSANPVLLDPFQTQLGA
ncbi:MAG TPA: proteasome accessory factor PafA2 family protein [Opitutaceae bacterium]